MGSSSPSRAARMIAVLQWNGFLHHRRENVILASDWLKDTAGLETMAAARMRHP